MVMSTKIGDVMVSFVVVGPGNLSFPETPKLLAALTDGQWDSKAWIETQLEERYHRGNHQHGHVNEDRGCDGQFCRCWTDVDVLKPTFLFPRW
jgi:hypothetical protein